MKIKLEGKKLIILIALIVLLSIIALASIGNKSINIISAITKSNKVLQYYDENTVFVLFTKYLDENQSVIAPTSVQTQTADKLDYEIDIPQIDGYTPLVDELKGTLDQEGMEYLESLDYVKVIVKDNIYNIYITITYDAAPSAYSIVYYEQNADLSGYTEMSRETIGGTAGNYTGEIYTGDDITISPEEKSGFNLNTEKTKLTGKVEAFGTKVFEVYYDRTPYYLYTFNTGDSYYEPMIIRYGQEINLNEEPTYSGYVFDGWAFSTSMDGEKISKPDTMPAYNIYAESKWIKSDTHYTLSYYTQNADDDGYTNIGTAEVAAVSGDNLKDEDQDDLKTIIENGFLTARGDTAKYYYYNEEKTKLENNNFDIVVEGKGITVVPIYFDRHVYNVTLDFDDDDYSTKAEVVMNGTTYIDSYTFQARYEQNLLEHWITADDFTRFPKSSRNYYFRGWKANGNSTTYVSLRLNLTSTMIEDADNDRNITYYAQYATSSTSRNLRYLFESFDQESTTTSDTRVLYNGKYYEVAEEYSQKVYSSSSMSAKEIAGVTNVGQKSSNSTYQFFYDRNILKITLYNMNNVFVEKELKYGQSIEEFVNTQLNPEDFSLETPGTKDWIFEGWYQDSNYMIPMVWTNSDGSYKTMTDNLVLYAKWSAPTYMVTFNTNGGTWTETDSRYVKVDENTYTLTVTEGESLVKPANPTKLGNVASAWNYDVNSESVEYLFSDSQKVYSDITLDLQYTPNMNIPYKVRYIEAQYDGETLIEDVSKYTNIVDLAPAKEVYNNAYGSTVEELPLDIYDNENEDNYFVVNLRSEKLTLTSENIDENVIYFLYAKNPIVPYTVYYVKYQEDANGNPITYDYGDIPADDVLLGKKDSVVAAGYATEIADDIDGWTINGSYSQTIKLTLKASQNTMYFYYNQNTTGEYLVNFFFMDENGEYAETADYTYSSVDAGGKVLYANDFVNFTFENGPTEEEYKGRKLDLEKSGDAYLIITTTSEISAMDLYFENETDLTYTVKYQDEDGNELLPNKVVENQMYSSIVTEAAPSLEGYKIVDSNSQKSIQIGLDTNEIIFTYAKRTDLSYTVNYYIEGTTTKLADSKVVTGQTYNSAITENAIDIEGCTKLTPVTQSITIGVNDNVINFYYRVRTDLVYAVKYLEQGTNAELSETKTVNGQTFKATVTENAIDISGYDKVGDTEKTITIAVTGNEIIFYYTKRVDLTYIVKYLEQGTNAELSETKTVNGQTFKATVIENAIDISGYDKVNPKEQSIILEVSGNEIVFYYTKRTDLSYTVRYLEQGTDTELSETKTVNGQTYKSQVTENAIEISGYNKVDATEKTITVEVSGNEIVFYYTKRTDLSYTVKYLEQGTNVELSTVKVVNGQTYKATVTEESIDINGYDKVNSKENITIEVAGNEIVFYYTKRTDLSYTVNYYEEGTENAVVQSKTVDGKTFEEQVTEQAIEVEGYNEVDPTEKTITIGMGENVINFYYTKRVDLSYTVKYLEKETNEVLSTEKVVNNQTFKAVVTEEGIDINGYDKVDPKEQSITIEVSGNEIVFYYTKRVDLSYTVKYLEQGTNEVLLTEKVVNGKTFKEIVKETTVGINGYNPVNTEETITIEVAGNEIVFLYTKQSGLPYKVEFYYNDRVDTSKTIEGMGTYLDTISNYQDNVLKGYKLGREENFPLTITTNSDENIIKVYYVTDESQTKEIKYTVEYYKENVLVEMDTQVNTKVVQELEQEILTVDKTAINTENKYFGYRLDKTEPGEIPEQVNNGDVIKVYYVIDEAHTKDLHYTVEYYKEGVIANEDTQVVSETVQILQPDTMDVNKGEINTVNKYVGYKLDKTLPTEIPDKIATGETIKVYYVIDENQRKDLSYTIEYYKDGEKQVTETKEVSINVQLLQPNTIPVDKSEMILSGKYVGYRLEKTSPSEIPSIVNDGDVIKIYYVKNQSNYTVEYYYEGKIDSSKTEKITATYEDIIKDYTDKNILGYRLEKTEGLPLKVSENEASNVIKIYYIIDDGNTKTLNYTVEYYKNGVLQEGDTQIEYKTVQILQPDTFEVDKTKINLTNKYVGYKLDSTNPNPIQDIATTGDVIKVYYVKDNFKYTVEYYYEGELDASKTEEIVDEYDKIIDVYPDKINEKYYLEKTENFPIKVTEDSSKNVIKVYYTKKLSTITVHYYWDGVNNLKSTKSSNIDDGEDGKFSVSQDVIIEDKVDTVHKIAAASDVAEKYELVTKPENEELTMKVQPTEVEYIYRLKDTKVIVNYIEKSSGKVLGTDTITGQVDDNYQAIPEPINGFEFMYDEVPENQVGKMTLEPTTVNFYYVVIPQGPAPSGQSPEQTTVSGIKGNYNGSKGPYTGDNEILINASIIIVILAINAIQLTVCYDSKKVKRSRTKTEVIGKETRKRKHASRTSRISRIGSDAKKATRRVRKH